MKKDIQRGQGNKLAEGATLVGEGNSPTDFAHHLRATPLDTKRKEVEGDPQYAAMNKGREKRTSQLRLSKDVKPI